MVHERSMNMENLRNDNDQILGGKPVPIPLCPPQIPHGQVRGTAKVSLVKVKFTLYRPPRV
jgi:hypothetical protein